MTSWVCGMHHSSLRPVEFKGGAGNDQNRFRLVSLARKNNNTGFIDSRELYEIVEKMKINQNSLIAIYIVTILF